MQRSSAAAFAFKSSFLPSEPGIAVSLQQALRAQPRSSRRGTGMSAHFRLCCTSHWHLFTSAGKSC